MGSWSDWDITNAQLTTSTYHSSPSSLQMPPASSAILKENVINDNLAEGQVVFWANIHGNQPHHELDFIFRSQGGDINQSFRVLIRNDSYYKYIQIHRGGTFLLSKTYDIGEGWQKFRITWWVSENHLIIRVEHYKNGDWYNVIEYSTTNIWANGGLVGFYNRDGNSGTVYVDDFSLYIP